MTNRVKVVISVIAIALLSMLYKTVSDIEYKQQVIRNELNMVKAQIEAMQLNDDRFYGYAKQFGENDLALLGYIGDLQCMIRLCGESE